MMIHFLPHFINIYFFCRTKRNFFSPKFNIRLYDKNSETYFFSLHQNQNIVFSNIGNQNISYGWSLNVLISEKFSQYDDTFSSSLYHSHYNKFINNSQFSALFVRKIVAVKSAIFFLQNLTLGYMTKTLKHIFFPSTKIRILFSVTLGIRIFV
jgi:hypothetical protein